MIYAYVRFIRQPNHTTSPRFIVKATHVVNEYWNEMKRKAKGKGNERKWKAKQQSRASASFHSI